MTRVFSLTPRLIAAIAAMAVTGGLAACGNAQPKPPQAAVAGGFHSGDLFPQAREIRRQDRW